MSFKEWRRCKLGDLCESISVTHNFQKDRLIFLNTGDIDRGKILHRDYSEINSMPGQAKKTIRKDDILFSEIRPANGRFAYIDFDADDYVVSTKLMVIRSKQTILPRFLYLLLTSNQITDWLQHLAESRSGTFPQITFTQVADIEINLPSKPEQENIVNFVYVIDDKIELNHQTNQTLEDIAQGIYKEWFVNFNFPGATGEMQDSELGPIPKGWRVGKLGDNVKTILGGTPSTVNKSFWENGTIGWINSGKTNEFRIIEPSAYITEEAVERSNTKRLPKGTVVLAITGATLGQVSRLEIDCCANQSVVGILENDLLPADFIYLWVKFNIGEIIKNQSGGAQQHINKNDVNNSLLLVPCTSVLNQFVSITKDIFECISNSCFEIATLSKTRDALLPKLMSGEIKHE